MLKFVACSSDYITQITASTDGETSVSLFKKCHQCAETYGIL
jgi:hypothetical protein